MGPQQWCLLIKILVTVFKKDIQEVLSGNFMKKLENRVIYFKYFLVHTIEWGHFTLSTVLDLGLVPNAVLDGFSMEKLESIL